MSSVGTHPSGLRSYAMIASPDRTPLARGFFDRPVLEAAPDRVARHGWPRHAYLYSTHGMSIRSA